MTWLRICSAAVADAEVELVARPLVHRRRHGQVLGLEGHAFVHVESVGAWLVRTPGVAIEAGVEMDVAFDEAGNDEGVAEIDRLSTAGGRVSRQDRGDAAVLDRDVMACAAVEAGVQEDLVEGHPVAPLVQF